MNYLSSKYFNAAVLLLVVSLFFRQTTQTALVKNGSNVCEKTVSFQQSFSIAYDSLQSSTYYTSCGFLWMSYCARYRHYYTTSYRTTYRTSYRQQYQCCKGWSQVGDQCTKAICTQPCVNGTCTKPDNCTCDPGYYGKQCDRDCPPHKWGPHCRHDCLCQNNATCSSHTGNCTCIPGWEGQYCNKTCEHGYYGKKCQNNCTCQNGATCDPVTGNCTCAAGYQGQRCEFPCKKETFGLDCEGNCSCRNKGICSHIDGSCVCTPGYTGKHCECIVRNGLLGCKSCNCGNWGTCDPFTGGCVCKPGSIGQSCRLSQCPNGTYVPGCNGNCECNNSATCYHGNSYCDCLPGWTGDDCANSCPPGYYGNECQSKCQVCRNGTSCDPITGQCICAGEWQGEVCVTGFNSTKLHQNKSHSSFVNTPLILSILGGFLVLFLISVALGCHLYRKQKPVYKVHRDSTTVISFSPSKKQEKRASVGRENRVTEKEEKRDVGESAEDNDNYKYSRENFCTMATESDNDDNDHVNSLSNDLQDSDDVIDIGDGFRGGDVIVVDGMDGVDGVNNNRCPVALDQHIYEPVIYTCQQPQPNTGSPVTFAYNNPCFDVREEEPEGLYYTIDGASGDVKASSYDRESLCSWEDTYESVGGDIVVQERGVVKDRDDTPDDDAANNTEA